MPVSDVKVSGTPFDGGREREGGKRCWPFPPCQFPAFILSLFLCNQDIKSSRYSVQTAVHSGPSRFSFTVLVMFLGKTSEMFGYIFSSTKTVELGRPNFLKLQGLLGLLALFPSIFGIQLTSLIAFNIANFFQLCSTLVGYDELDGGFEPMQKRGNLLNK